MALNIRLFAKDLVFVWAWWTWNNCASDWYIAAVYTRWWKLELYCLMGGRRLFDARVRDASLVWFAFCSMTLDVSVFEVRSEVDRRKPGSGPNASSSRLGKPHVPFGHGISFEGTHR